MLVRVQSEQWLFRAESTCEAKRKLPEALQ